LSSSTPVPGARSSAGHGSAAGSWPPNRHGGIDLRLDEGYGFRLPPDLSTFEWAYPGEYPDDATGELVENPDVRATWHIMAPDRPPDAFWRMFGRREGEVHAA